MPRLETIIASATEVRTIQTATKSYLNCIAKLAYPARIKSDPQKVTPALASMEGLRETFHNRLKQSMPLVVEIIGEVNQRTAALRDLEFKELSRRDDATWNIFPEKKPPIYGTLACVDKGIPVEAVMGLKGEMGRTLAGDINIRFIPSKKSFVAVESALTKRLIHLSRQEGGDIDLVEPMIVHTICGRMGQLLANEFGGKNMPSLADVFNHLDFLSDSFKGDSKSNMQLILEIKKMWASLDRSNSTVQAPDGGLYASVIMKIAERQGLMQSLEGQFKHKILPIEIYDKNNGDLIVGMDNLDILTDPGVLEAKGFTKEVLSDLTSRGKLFSIGAHRDEIERLLKVHSEVPQGKHDYLELQTDWLNVQGSLVGVTETLWKLYDAKNEEITNMVGRYIKAMNIDKLTSNKNRTRRLIHHLFHTIAYAYVLDTFNRGNLPGKHIEDHLAIGDHEIGAKTHMALGQGDLSRPNAIEILTGYSVLLHSKPGKDKSPVVVMIKLDTDRTGDQPISTEETNTAIEDFREFLKLWPYFLVGDLIPILAIREKDKGGISRLAQSVILAFGDIDDLYEGFELPRFVPASTSSGEVVLVPADEVLRAGMKAGEDLGEFRRLVKIEADHHNIIDVQKAFHGYVGY